MNHELNECKARLLAALERAARAESALRRLADECENDCMPGWEERMDECIKQANVVLAANQEAA